MKRRIKLSPVVIFMMLLASCSILSGKRGAEVSYQYTVPEQTDDGWQTAHIAEAKIDEKILTELVQNILNDQYGDIDSILIVKDGKLMFEKYFSGSYYGIIKNTRTRDDTHSVMSVSKSFTSTLIGIAIDKGMIKDVNEDLVSIFPEHKELIGDNGGKIKLRHLLSMSAGFD